MYQATRSNTTLQAGSAASRLRMLSGASFLLVGLAIGNWPTQSIAQSTLARPASAR
jgi:hypothetical protein